MHPYALVLARFVLGSMWVIAGLGKLADREPRGRAVADFGLLPRPTADVLGTALPWIELALGILLLVGLGTAPAAAASAGLLAVFTLAISINLARGRKIECHCFGQWGRARISWASVARNLALLGAALMLVRFRQEYLTLEGWIQGAALPPTDPPVLDFVPVLLLAVSGILVWSLGVSAWEVAQALARAEGGPSLGLPERRFLRRWLAPGPGGRGAEDRG